MRPVILLLLALLLIVPRSLQAQQAPISDTSMVEKKVQMPYKIRRLYTGKAFDLALLSSSLMSRPGMDAKLTIPRFTLFFNGGFNVHYDMSRYFGVFSGLTVKNIGYIEKEDGITTKRRVYSLGLPLGVKVGDLRNRNFFFFGGGVDMPFHYKEKVFEDRGDKDKFREWFSDRTPTFMPFLFLGNSWDPGIVLKLQYYPMSFLNKDYVDNGDPSMGIQPFKPYAGSNVNLILLSLGIDIHYGQYKVQEREYQEWRRARAREREAQRQQ